MLDIRNLRIDPASLGTKKLLIDVTAAREYVNGQRTENITGYRYHVVLPEQNYEKLAVKIDGAQLLEKPAEGFVEVQFEGLEISLYLIQGRIQISAKASAISVVGNKKQ